jgi:transposase InsO family protein
LILRLVGQALEHHARVEDACAIVGVSKRTLERWRKNGGGDDLRSAPDRKKTSPSNKLSVEERSEVIETVNRPEFRNLSPKQIVPILAERGIYIASEATIARILKENNQNTHRTAARPPRRHRPKELFARGKNQVWSWDITYLQSDVRGAFFFLYMAVDVWSRKIVGWTVEDVESADLAAKFIDASCRAEEIERRRLTLHADNGGPMKGSTMLATLRVLGVAASFSRPSTSNDNAFSEALFRTLKYSSLFTRKPFESLSDARAWVEVFVRWYNNEHRHSAIGFVTPAQRHEGEDVKILTDRARIYELAKKKHPERWTGDIRNCARVELVRLNPALDHSTDLVA